MVRVTKQEMADCLCQPPTLLDRGSVTLVMKHKSSRCCNLMLAMQEHQHKQEQPRTDVRQMATGQLEVLLQRKFTVRRIVQTKPKSKEGVQQSV